jgi:hypothetical protein
VCCYVPLPPQVFPFNTTKLSIEPGTVFASVASVQAALLRHGEDLSTFRFVGNLDGMDVDARGNVFATGAGGVWMFNAAGELLGGVVLNIPVGNCLLEVRGVCLFVCCVCFVCLLAYFFFHLHACLLVCLFVCFACRVGTCT